MTELLVGTPDISTAIDCLLGLAVVAGLTLVVYRLIWRRR